MPRYFLSALVGGSPAQFIVSEHPLLWLKRHLEMNTRYPPKRITLTFYAEIPEEVDKQIESTELDTLVY